MFGHSVFVILTDRNDKNLFCFPKRYGIFPHSLPPLDDPWNWPLLHQVWNIHPNGKTLKSTLQGLLLFILKGTFWSKTSGLLSPTPQSRAPVSSPALTLHTSDFYQYQKPEYFSFHNKLLPKRIRNKSPFELSCLFK